MRQRKRSAEDIFQDLGTTCQVLQAGIVHTLYPNNEIPDSVLSRMYSHVADNYKLYLVGTRYLLEFREQCNQNIVYRALFLDSRPESQEIGELFERHTHLYSGAAWVYAMTDFDQLALLSSGPNVGKSDEIALKAILTFFGLAFTGLAMVGTENGEKEPTATLSRVGLGLIGTGFLYIGKRLFP